jgi:hypothetical protein
MASGANRSLAIISPSYDFGRSERGFAIETTAKLAGFNFSTVMDYVFVSGVEFLEIHPTISMFAM